MSFMKVVDRFRTLAERFMVTDVTIYRRQPYAADDTNPFGDDTVEYSGTPIQVKGWVTAKPTTGAAAPDAGQVVQVGLVHVRIPAETVVEAGDRLILKGEEFLVEDTTLESDYAVWVDVWLRHLQ